MGDGWLRRHVEALPARGRLLELGCGDGDDSADLQAQGFSVVACDIDAEALARTRAWVGPGSLLRVDHRERLPFSNGSFDGAIASLSLHYFPWAVTIAAFEEVRRVLRPGAPFAFRVNATDDVEYGATSGVEVEANLRFIQASPGARLPYVVTTQGSSGELKRFFDEPSVIAALGTNFDIATLEHREVDRWRRPKQVWECLALAR